MAARAWRAGRGAAAAAVPVTLAGPSAREVSACVARPGAYARRMKSLLAALLLSTSIPLAAAETEPGFVRLFDGRTFAGWKSSVENSNTWRIEDGAFVTRGPRAHLFYVGDERPFTNFHLKVEVMTEPRANGGIYFHTRYQESDWPRVGFESQVNTSHSDWKKTGSLYDVVNVSQPLSRDGQWWTQEILVEGRKVTVKVDGVIVLEYTEPPGAQAGAPFTRKLAAGTFGLQAHDPGSVVRYRNIRVKRLP